MRFVKFLSVVYLGGSLVVGAAASEPQKFGAGVSLEHATPLQAVLAKPDEYVGKRIRVDGVVSAVCEEMGCWIELSDPALGKGLRFKVDDGVIVFPISAKGKKASAEGTLERLEIPAGKTEHDVMHAAEAKAGETGAKAETKKPAHPQTPAAEARVLYQVKATGAIVY